MEHIINNARLVSDIYCDVHKAYPTNAEVGVTNLLRQFDYINGLLTLPYTVGCILNDWLSSFNREEFGENH